MKILLVLCEMQDLGGIINHTEHLIHGLKSLGHDVTFINLQNRVACYNSTTTSRKTKKGFSTGLQMDQSKGWLFPESSKFPFQSGKWRSFTDAYDLVIWETPVPRIAFGDEWAAPYDLRVPQMVFLHDGNMVKLYPWFVEVAHKFKKIACVHPAALGNATHCKLKTAELVLNPQAYLNERMVVPGSIPKLNQVCSFQTFKAWKRVHEIVGAAPKFDATLKLYGGGIEYHYMSGKKRKVQYGTIWDDAIASGKMQFHTYVDEETRDSIIKESKILIDASWSRGQNLHGALFNRTMVESIICGTVPLLREPTMKNNGVFPESTYFTAPHPIKSYDEFADSVNFATSRSEPVHTAMVRYGQDIVRRRFDSKIIAQQLLEL